MKQEDRDVALDSRHFRAPGSRNFINISTLDESDKQVFNTIFYKEIPMGEDETLIVTYSPKYKAYQRTIRQAQIQRAQKLIDSPGKKTRRNNPNDPARFIEKQPYALPEKLPRSMFIAWTKNVYRKNPNMMDSTPSLQTSLEIQKRF